jgi:putative membrane-bound dehydrogenase-like protein
MQLLPFHIHFVRFAHWLAVLLVFPVAEVSAAEIGVARIDVTPSESIRLTGYGGRTTNSIGIEQKLWAKALAIGTDSEGPAVLVTLDNCGIAEETYREMVKRLGRVGIRQDRLAIACSHTHTGPCTTHWAPNIFSRDIPPDQQATIDRYTRELIDKLEQVARAALKDRRPGKLSWSQGSVAFARNRRVVVGDTARFGDNATGPVDHALPVLKVEDADGKLRAIIANYACHCTTLGGEFNRVCGDWAGYAQEYIERENPGALAMITIGCGADANPFPRGGADAGLALARQHGEELATEVKRLLAQTFVPLNSRLATRFKEIALPFGPHFSREQWEIRAKKDSAVGYHARKNLARLDRGEKLPTELYYPIVTWNFGDGLAWVFLPGEVVVDYALRLKQEFDPTRLWVTAYANYVPCYIPSRRILAEDGYEAEDSLWYYDRPARISTNAEDLIIKTVHELLPTQFLFDKKRAEYPEPKSPAQALATFRTKAEFVVELVASEPLIESPVAIEWDTQGRLWVCEMYDYPTGVDVAPDERRPTAGNVAFVTNPPSHFGGYKPGGRIKVLSDTNHDGHYDKATLFLDGLSFPTGVMPWRKGAFICAAPDILYAEDTDGDGRADVVRTNFTGFATHNYQARVNGFTWGLDGWLHGSSGLFGGKIKSVITGKTVDLSGRDFRIQPDTGEIEAVTGISQMGRVRDDFDNWFGNDNSTLLWHYPLPERYARRNPYVTYPDPRVNVATVAADVRRLTSTQNSKPATRNGDQSLLTSAATDPNQLFPISRTLERFNDPQMANRVTSACGPCIYRDDLLGTNYYGNAFICEPVHNLVTRLVLEPNGLTFAAHRAPDETRSEFLASTDNWFRPVQVRTGPDGALWIVDMYRFVIEHPRWIPSNRLAQLDVRAGADMGRIYRVYPKGANLRPGRDLTHLDDFHLTALFNSANGPARDLAQGELAQRGTSLSPASTNFLDEKRSTASARGAAETPALLCRLATNSTHAAIRAQALATLSQSGLLSRDVLAQAVENVSPDVRRLAIRFCEAEFGSSDLHPVLGSILPRLITESDPAVRFQLALSLGEWKDSRAGEALAKLARTDDRWIRSAVLSSALPHFAELLKNARDWPASIPGKSDFVARLCRAAAASGDSERVQRALDAIVPAHEDGHDTSWYAALATLFDAMARQSMALEPLLAKSSVRDGVCRAIASARACASNSSGDETMRENSIRLLARQNATVLEDIALLCHLLLPPTTARLQNAALDRLGAQHDHAVAASLLSQWTQYSPSLRPRIVALLLAREDWTCALLASVKDGDIARSEIAPAEQQKLVHHKSQKVRDLASSLFQRVASRSEMLAKYRAVASITGAPADGAAVFDRNCAQCHSFDGHGHEVGPNLAEFAGKSVQDFLVAILDPNAAVNPNFVAYNIEMKDGRSLSGIVKGETASSLTLMQGGGIEETILRQDIEEIRAGQLSLMPEGLELALSPQDLVDLIAWLKKSAPE